MLSTVIVRSQNNQVKKYCSRCKESFQDYEFIASTNNNQFWHLACFVCSHCFRPFGKKQLYYDFQGRLYCERDFKQLFAPACNKCNNFIIGRFIRAIHKTYHPNCFLCYRCNCPLADLGFYLKDGTSNKMEALCHGCHTIEKGYIKKLMRCTQCKNYIGSSNANELEKPLYIKNQPYHSYHFNCNACGIELTPDARSVNGSLYCIRCHDKLGIQICGGCRRPIEERVVTALGRHWHPEHFVCCVCEKPFHGKKHFEVRSKAYCEEHFYQCFGIKCSNCFQFIKHGSIVNALSKFYCEHHFWCFYCKNVLIVNKSDFFDVESNPCCKKCFRKMPVYIRKQSRRSN